MKVTNPRARFDYELLERFEAGLVLKGSEVKSIKAGKISLKESFVKLYENEAWLYNAHVHPYPFADNQDYNPTRPRKLLLHRKELLKLYQKTEQKRLTIVPLSCYTKGRNIKLEIALARGKKKYEKKEAKKRKDLDREAERILKNLGGVRP